MFFFSGLYLGSANIGKGAGLTFCGILMILIGLGFGCSAAADLYMLIRVSSKIAYRENAYFQILCEIIFDIQRYSNSMYLFSRFTNYIEAPELHWLKPKLNSHQASWVMRLFAKRPPKRRVKALGLNSQMPLLMVDPDKAKEEIDSNLSCDTTLLQFPKKCALFQKLRLVEKLSQQNPVLQNFKCFDQIL